MTQTLHVVMGAEGEYSGRSEWPVRAFTDPVRAATHVVQATARANEIINRADALGVPAYGSESAHFHNEFDPSGGRPSAYEGPFVLDEEADRGFRRYYVMPVPLDDDVRASIASAFVTDGTAGRRALAVDGLKKKEQA